MGNERRLVILCHLSEREHSVTELCRLVGLSQSALSQHLAKLRRDNLVKTRRSAQTVYYSVASPEVAPLLKSLSELFPPLAPLSATARGGTRSGGRATALASERRGAESAGDRALWRKSEA
ncbi:MAG: metalloregulator ArsR/SmtB family transcription factor [Kiloniellaceae bacterium]